MKGNIYLKGKVSLPFEIWIFRNGQPDDFCNDDFNLWAKYLHQYISYIAAVSFFVWRKPGNPKNTTDLIQGTDHVHQIISYPAHLSKTGWTGESLVCGYCSRDCWFPDHGPTLLFCLLAFFLLLRFCSSNLFNIHSRFFCPLLPDHEVLQSNMTGSWTGY